MWYSPISGSFIWPRSITLALNCMDGAFRRRGLVLPICLFRELFEVVGNRVVDPNASEQAGAEGVDLVAWVLVVDKAAWKARKKEASKPITSKWDRYLVIERLFNSFSTLGWTFCTKKWCAFASIPPRAYSFYIRSYRPRSIPTTILLVPMVDYRCDL